MKIVEAVLWVAATAVVAGAMYGYELMQEASFERNALNGQRNSAQPSVLDRQVRFEHSVLNGQPVVIIRKPPPVTYIVKEYGEP